MQNAKLYVDPEIAGSTQSRHQCLLAVQSTWRVLQAASKEVAGDPGTSL